MLLFNGFNNLCLTVLLRKTLCWTDRLISNDHHDEVDCTVLRDLGVHSSVYYSGNFPIDKSCLCATLLKSRWALPELHPGGHFCDKSMKSYMYTGYKLEYNHIQAEFWHAVKTGTSFCITSFGDRSPFHFNPFRPRMLAILHKFAKTRQGGIFRVTRLGHYRRRLVLQRVWKGSWHVRMDSAITVRWIEASQSSSRYHPSSKKSFPSKVTTQRCQ